MTFLSLQAGIRKDVQQDIQLKLELAIKNYLNHGSSISYTRKNLFLKKKEVFLKPFQALNSFNSHKWIGSKLDFKSVGKDLIC